MKVTLRWTRTPTMFDAKTDVPFKIITMVNRCEKQ